MTSMLFAGFGGQGILFTGKFIAYCGMLGGYEVTWLPSYGPEMRGGTANCSVILSDKPIGSPIADNPDILVAMNLPSFDKFEEKTVSGAKIFIDSTFVSRKAVRTDIEAFYTPVTELADSNELSGLANMIMVGKLLKEVSLFDKDLVVKAMGKTVSERKKNLYDANIRAIELGMGL